MTLVDAPEEDQERARKEEEAAQERYLRQVEIMAMREAQRMGLSGEQASEYVVSQRAEAEVELQQELEDRDIASNTGRIAAVAEQDEAFQAVNEVREHAASVGRVPVEIPTDAVAMVEGISQQNFDLSFLDTSIAPERPESSCPTHPVAKDDVLSPC